MKEKIKSLYRFLNPKFQTIHLEYKVDVTPRYSAKKPIPLLDKIISSQEENYKKLLSTFLEKLDVKFIIW